MEAECWSRSCCDAKLGVKSEPSLAIDSLSISKVLVNVSGLSDLISSRQQWLLLRLYKVLVSSETCVSSLNGLCAFHKPER